MSEILTIEGKILSHNYSFKIKPKLCEFDFIEAMEKNKRVFKSVFSNKEIAISVWTTPKRTKTYPFTRVYDTLNYDGPKITLIPVMVDYGKHGERGKIQPNTIDWMTSVGVYVILGIYINADKGKVGKLAKNAGVNTKSSEGKPKFAQGQQFDLDYLKKQIQKIIVDKPEVNEWNENQLNKIPNFLSIGINNYEKLGKKLKVPLGDFSKMKKKVSEWKDNQEQFLKDCEKMSKSAQNREANSSHVLEYVPGKKGKININFGKSRKLYLTADSMKLQKNKCLVTLLEGKNTSRKKYPSWEDIKDALIKLMIFKNSEFYFEGKKYDKKLICYLTGQGDDAEKDFREEYKSLIDECNANKIELKFNGKSIK